MARFVTCASCQNMYTAKLSKGISLRSGATDMAVKKFGAHICTLAEFGHWEKVVVTR